MHFLYADRLGDGVAVQLIRLADGHPHIGHLRIQRRARPLRRAIQRLVEDELSDELLRGTIKLGDRVCASSDGEKAIFVPEPAGVGI